MWPAALLVHHLHLSFCDTCFLTATAMFVHRLLKWFEACVAPLIHHRLPDVAQQRLTDLAKSERWTLSLRFSIGIINAGGNLTSRLLVTTSNETHRVCDFLPLIRIKTDLLRHESLFTNVLDVCLSLLLRLFESSGFSPCLPALT